MNRIIRSTVLAALAIIVAVVPMSGCGTSEDREEVQLHILLAGSMVIPFGELEEAFEQIHPYIDVLNEGHGSIQVIRHITEIYDEADLAVVADYSLLPMLMYPAQIPDGRGTYANWTISFASNRLGIAYTPDSLYADEINSDNWYQILSRDDVFFGFSDPRFDACGYRTLMLIQLAEDYYSSQGLFHNLVTSNFQAKIRISEADGVTTIKVPELFESTNKRIKLRGFSVQLLALLESHDIDYAFQYESVARQHGLEFLPLPGQIDLSSVDYASEYSKVRVELDYQRYASVNPEFQGQPIIYGITIPANAPHPEEAIEFIKFLLSSDGQQILADVSQPVMTPAVDEAANLPAELSSIIG